MTKNAQIITCVSISSSVQKNANNLDPSNPNYKIYIFNFNSDR